MWIKLDDGFATHPKILNAGLEAMAVQVRAICYASRHKTDGFIPQSAVCLFLSDLPPRPEGWAAYMVQCRLWELAENGYQVHDYLDWNISKTAYLEMKEKLSKAGKKGMKSRWKRSNQGYKAGNNLSDNPTHNQPYNKTITQQSTSISSLNPLNAPNPKSNGSAKLSKGKRAISEDDKPTEKHFHFGAALKIDVGPEWGKFKNYCLAHDKRYANFEAAFRNWLANARDRKERRP